jgi:sugar lactone lactonase YvrE
VSYVIAVVSGRPAPSIRELLPFRIRCANSTAFSPDGRTMYHTDSPSRQILAWDYDTETVGLRDFAGALV